MPELSIIIPTFNRDQILSKTLKAANEAIAGVDAEIIVVNDSKVSTPQIPPAFTATKLINNPLQGPASARNLGARMASAANLLFMDDDFIISQTSVMQLLNLLRSYPKDCFNFLYEYPPELYQKINQTQFGRYLIAKGFTRTKIPAEILSPDGLFENPECLGSGFLAIRKDLFQMAGGYDEVCKFAGEDAALMENLKGLGARVLINSRCIVYHNEEDRTGLKSWLKRQYYGIKSTLQAQSEQGGIQLKWPYSGMKEFILKISAFIYPLYYWLLWLIPNYEVFDVLYFKIVDLLYVTFLYKGYQEGFESYQHLK